MPGARERSRQAYLLFVIICAGLLACEQGKTTRRHIDEQKLEVTGKCFCSITGTSRRAMLARTFPI